MNNETNSSNKSGLLNFSRELADLILSTNGDNVWLESKEVRRAWHTFIISTSIMSFTLIIYRVVFAGILRVSPFYTTSFRILLLVWSTISLICAIMLGYQYYKNLLITGRDLRFGSIAFFIMCEILLFGLIYIQLYFLNPELFMYQSPPIIPTETYIDYGLPTLIANFEFILYSACTNISINYPKIASNSSIVSVINFLQVLIWLAIMGLFIATFVQLAAKRKK